MDFIELHKRVHDRKAFDCGEFELNDFLKTKAAQHAAVGISKTLVLTTPEHPQDISAFYTVVAATVSSEVLPQNLPSTPIPVFLIAQMAVALPYHGQGLGKITLIKALEYLWRVSKSMPANAIILDCLNGEVEGFYSKFGFERLYVHNNRVRMFLPMKTVNQLFEGE